MDLGIWEECSIPHWLILSSVHLMGLTVSLASRTSTAVFEKKNILVLMAGFLFAL